MGQILPAQEVPHCTRRCSLVAVFPALEFARWYQYFQTVRRSISSIVYFWSYGCVCLRVLNVHISVLILYRGS